MDRVQIATMKKCSYCGAEYPDEATECLIDKTPLGEDAPPPTVKVPPNPAARLVAKCILGIFLINTGIYFAVGRTYLIIFNQFHPDHVHPQHGYPIMIMYGPVGWFLTVCFLLLAFIVCRKKCPDKRQALIVAVVAMCLTLLAQGTVAMLAIPAFLVGLATNSSAVSLIVSAIQIVAGAWLLGWFNRS